MKGSTYILTAAALITGAAALQNGERYISHLPQIVQEVSQQIKNCEDRALQLTVTQGIACLRGVNFADVRKMDMRSDNRLLSRNLAKSLIARN